MATWNAAGMEEQGHESSSAHVDGTACTMAAANGQGAVPHEGEGRTREAIKPARCEGTAVSVYSVVFLPTLACNCTCTHCFERTGPVTMGESRWRMVFGEVRELADLVRCRTMRVYWQGGEVLSLQPESVASILEAAADAFAGSGVTVEHHLQTNLLLYDSARWRDVMRAFALGTISSSLDYPNRYRQTPSLSPDEYNRAWLRKKDEAECDGFAVSIVSLPNPGTLEIGAERWFSYFRDEVRVQNLQVNFPFPGQGEGLEPLDLGNLAAFMADLHGIWVASGDEIHLSPFRGLRDRMEGRVGTLPCIWSASCANSLLAIAPDGRVGQCDCWVSNFDGHEFGVIGEDDMATMLAARPRSPFVNRSFALARDTECGECEHWNVCFGGCPVRAFAFGGDMLAPDHYCSVYKEMMNAVRRHAAGLATTSGS
ncbi:MAG: hypothetical protein CL910_16005 [Deltaproteobacteria bacterium]|jgi:radical SAM protein with 4Fe4S-binding SPASM domain|nr:hypothetical protein [Deltaproteobacteria bacterium]